jgi:hypothetical protein
VGITDGSLYKMMQHISPVKGYTRAGGALGEQHHPQRLIRAKYFSMAVLGHNSSQPEQKPFRASEIHTRQ